MHRTVNFKTAEPEEWTFDENDAPEVPGGEALAQKLRAGIVRVAKSASDVSQHSYYGWRFEVAFEAVTVECVLNVAGEEGYFTIAPTSLLPSWLFRGRRRAFAACERAFDELLRQLPEISAVTWS